MTGGRLDPVSKIFSAVNKSALTQFSFLSIRGPEPVLDMEGVEYVKGWARGEKQEIFDVVTFVLVLPPKSSALICRLTAPQVLEEMFYALPWEPLRPVQDTTGGPGLCFPLQIEALCTQSVGGPMTHFFCESFHAVDFRCPVSTPLLAVGDGTVFEVADSNVVSGIWAENLGKWNSISIDLECGPFRFDYVHIKAGSARVRPGDKVARGQIICESGDVGFSPEPHVHLEMHRIDDLDGPSEPFLFTTSADVAYVPVACRVYGPQGEVGVSDFSTAATACASLCQT